MRWRKSGRLPLIITGLVMVALIVTIVLGYRYIKQLKEQNASLQQELDAISDGMTQVYLLAGDVKAGNSVEESDLTIADIPNEAVPQNAILSEDQLEGKMYKTDLAANTPLCEDLLIDQTLTDDMRELDVVMTEIPIGLEAGDYIDVRISFPLGQDFIAITHKKVEDINGSVVKLIVTEDDFYSYESMKTDYASYQAVKIYGVKYVEAGTQKAAAVYYPVTLDILKTKILDPNIETSDYAKTLSRRKVLEEQLIDADMLEKNASVTGNKATLDSLFAEASNIYEQLQAQKEADAAAADSTSDEETVQLN